MFQKNSLIEKFLEKERGGGGSSRFCRIFLSHRTETEIFAKEPFCFPEKVWYRKKLMDERRHITIFSGDFFTSQYQKNSLGNTSVHQKILGSEKLYA